MNKTSNLLIKMFETDMWQYTLDKATNKEIDLNTIKQMCYPLNREKLLTVIMRDEYNIFPPHIAKIPKDKPGEFREVYINEPLDRIILSLINDSLCVLFKDMIHSHCVSYQKGIGTQQVIKTISTRLSKITHKTKNSIVGYKIDFSKYFDNVYIEAIDNVFDNIEKQLGFDKDTEPVLNLLRRYYHQDLYFDCDGKLQHRFQSLKQGCSVASFLANVILYELDEFMSNKYEVYYRYSDDLIVLDENISSIIDDINSIVTKYGVSLNPNKVEPIYKDKWVKFLGFNIKDDLITLSKTRVKKFQKEVEERTINKKKKYSNYNSEKAMKSLFNYLYVGEYCWASSCLGVINVENDLKELDKYIIDSLKACETGKVKIGGLGSASNLKDKTILRGKGKNVKANRYKVPTLEHYVTLTCLSNCMKMHKSIFDAVIRNFMKEF